MRFSTFAISLVLEAPAGAQVIDRGSLCQNHTAEQQRKEQYAAFTFENFDKMADELEALRRAITALKSLTQDDATVEQLGLSHAQENAKSLQLLELMGKDLVPERSLTRRVPLIDPRCRSEKN